MQQSLDEKLSKREPYVQSLNTLTGNVVITPTSLGLGKVNNTTDLDKPISNSTQQALDTKVDNTTFSTYRTTVSTELATKIPLSQKAAASGLATLDTNKLVPVAQVPILPKEKVPLAVAAEGFKDAVTVKLTGDILGSFTIDGRTPSISINTSFVTSPTSFAGTYGSSAAIPVFSVDTRGQLTSASQVAIPTASLAQEGLVRLNDTIGTASIGQAATIASVTRVNTLVTNLEASTVKTSSVGKPNGVASLDSAGRLPRDQLPLSGAIVADSLYKTITMSMTGDATWSLSFNGTENVSAPLTLTSILSKNIDTVQGSATTTPLLKVNEKGLVTEVSSTPIKIPFTSVNATPNTLGGYGITDTYTKTELESLIKSLLDSAIPSGTVSYYAARTAPNGWLFCDGRAVSRTTYSKLFAVIGTTYGSGDGTTTFNLPDLRGEFIRGWSSSRGVDTGRGFASLQSDMLGSHSHNVLLTGFCHGKDSGRHTDARWSSGDVYYNRTLSNAGDIIEAAGGAETRPRNIALLPMIKV